MQHTTTWLLSLALALAVAVASDRGMACDLCAVSEPIACLHESILDHFQTGGGDQPAEYRVQGNGWLSTSVGPSLPGKEAILTWSIVPDGTTLPQGVGEPASPSNLIAFLDDIHHGGPGPGGHDYTQRAWFPLIKSAFDRWDALSAVRFTYETHDDGVRLGSYGGIQGVRGDHRIGGHSIDGTTSPTTVAYNFFPNNSDMVIDTDEVDRLGHPGGNYVRFRNTLMHEIGHGLGLNHVGSSDSHFLMEALLDATIDGPQFDDILGIQRLYGDRHEKFGGNDTAATATYLGTLLRDQPITIGADAANTHVGPTDVDFVSINIASDVDYFRFTASSAGQLSVLLTPMGPSYQEGPSSGGQTIFHAANQNDLSLFLYDETGVNLLASSAAGGLGVAESIFDYMVTAASDFVIRVSGVHDKAQFYQLDVSLVPEPTALVLLIVGVIAGGATRARMPRR